MKKNSCIWLNVSCLLQSSGIHLDLYILSPWFCSCFCKAASKITEITNITIGWISRIKRKCLNKVKQAFATSLTANCKQNFIKIYFWKLFNAIKKVGERTWLLIWCCNLSFWYVLDYQSKWYKFLLFIIAVVAVVDWGC